VGKKKKWSDEILKRARVVVENNLRSPMVREDQQLGLPIQNRAQRGISISPNEALLVFLHHHRPRLFWDVTVVWKELPTTDLFLLGERAYDCFRLVLTEAEIKAGEWDQLPTHRAGPMMSIVCDYIPTTREDAEYHELVRRQPDWDDYDLSKLTGRAEDAPLVLPSPEQIRQLS
jgi:hypothetical protein